MTSGLAVLAFALMTFPKYAETIWLNGDGSARVEIEVACPAGTPSPFRIPLTANLTGITIRSVEHATASMVTEADRRYASIDLGGTLAVPVTLLVSGTAGERFGAMKTPPKEFGNRTMTYRFLNSTPAAFGTVSNQVVLPDGYVVTAVDDSEPPSSESSTTPPYALVYRDGRHAITITARDVGLGDAVSVTFRFKERRVPPLIPIALFLLGAAYLVGFRSLTSPPDSPE